MGLLVRHLLDNEIITKRHLLIAIRLSLWITPQIRIGKRMSCGRSDLWLAE
ncbi:hypothetical protein X956_08080 [Trueperella pyogenes TP8]|nr:hypothetical protein X956_08080 [Trueperella pyogenes TP8]